LQWRVVVHCSGLLLAFVLGCGSAKLDKMWTAWLAGTRLVHSSLVTKRFPQSDDIFQAKYVETVLARKPNSRAGLRFGLVVEAQ
jgi:hypothetical protein